MARPRRHRRFRLPRAGNVAAVQVAAVALLFALAPADAHAQNKKYKYETDPVRLGLKSVDKGMMKSARAYFDEAIENNYRVPEAHRGIGEIYLLQGLYDDARIEFSKALEGDDPVAEAHAGLGLVYLRQEKNAEAEGEFRKGLEQDGNLWRAQYGLACIAIEKGDLATAEKLLEKGKKKKGVEDGEHFYEHGQALLLTAQGRLEEAETHALKALDLTEGANPDIVLTVGTVYEKRGVRPLAILKLEEIRDDPAVVANKAQIHFRLGVLYAQERRFKDAIESYQAAVEADPGLAEAYLHVGAIFMSAHQPADAIAPYHKYTELVPDDPDGQRRLAEACIEARNLRYREIAFDAASRAIELEPKNETNRLVLARAAANSEGKTDLALQNYELVGERNYEGIDYFNLGNLNYRVQIDEPAQLRDFEDARFYYQTAIELDSTLTDVYYRLGVLDLVDGDWQSAEENFHQANRFNPNNSQILSYLGQTKLQQREFPDAAALFIRASELAPADAAPIVLLAQCHTFMQRYAEAIAAYNRALELDPTNGQALGGRGHLLLLDKKFPEAERDLRGATEANPDSDRNWAFLGQALHFQGKLLEARAAYDRALAINPQNQEALQGKAGLAGSAGQ